VDGRVLLHIWAMERPPPIYTKCGNCGADYKVVRVESSVPLPHQPVCSACGAPLQGRQGRFVLKYAIVKRRAKRGRAIGD
jgi:hypothetical protein